MKFYVSQRARCDGVNQIGNAALIFFHLEFEYFLLSNLSVNFIIEIVDLLALTSLIIKRKNLV